MDVDVQGRHHSEEVLALVAVYVFDALPSSFVSDRESRKKNNTWSELLSAIDRAEREVVMKVHAAILDASIVDL